MTKHEVDEDFLIMIADYMNPVAFKKMTRVVRFQTKCHIRIEIAKILTKEE